MNTELPIVINRLLTNAGVHLKFMRALRSGDSIALEVYDKDSDHLLIEVVAREEICIGIYDNRLQLVTDELTFQTDDLTAWGLIEITERYTGNNTRYGKPQHVDLTMDHLQVYEDHANNGQFRLIK